MERAWKVINLFIGLVLIGLCSGFPIGLENSAADYHTQFLTGLVGVLLTVCGVVFLAGCLCCQRKNGFKEFHNNPVVASSSTTSLDHGHINPIANGEFTIFTPLSPPVHNNNVFLANEQIVGQTEIDYNHAEFDVRLWFDGTENDFPRTRLKYIKELGKGWFGRVVEGTAQISNDEKQNWTPVAVRILEASATSGERAVFLHDAVIYRCGKHPHILQLLGRSLESVPLLLLQELCPHGNLKRYLRDNRATVEKLLSSDLPLLWCCQLSSALKHLHDHKLTHPDLAARNCQVMSDLSIKLGDYGLAASLYPEDYYEGAPAVPVRWCAPESLTYTSTTIQPKQITFEGNIWSLGVTMWEIYECGAQPYANLTDDDVLSQVLGSANVRLSKPEFSILYTDYIFRLMQLCWSTSESRPSISQVHLMLTDLMQVYQNTKHITHSEPPISIQDFDRRWDTFKPNSVAKTDNHEFVQESMSMADIDLSDITILNLNLSKDEELLNTKPMSPSLNNLHGSLDNLAVGCEMDSWLQKVATKTGDMSYVRGLSEAIKDLDNALALENFSSSDSSHQPSPAPENAPNVKNKLEFKLGPTYNISNDSNNKTQDSSLTESVQRTSSSESETEDENWRRKIECGAYSEKVHQKSKSVTDLMVLTHIDCSESDSETPLPSLDYRVNYKNVRYAPKQNLENVSLMFGSEGNLLSVHDKFQEELKRLQEERKDSLLFVPESISLNDEKFDKPNIKSSRIINENSSSDEEEITWSVGKSEDTATCTYVNIHPSTRDHRNTESLIEELSSPSDIQPSNQVYNIFNVTVDAKYSPIHLKSNLKEIICFTDQIESNETNNKNINSESSTTTKSFQVPKLTELIQNNDDLMNYIITRYDSQEDINTNPPDVNNTINISEEIHKELNNNIQNDLPSSSTTKTTDNLQTVTQNFLQIEQENYELPKVHFDISQTQEEVFPSSMTHFQSLFTSTPFIKRGIKNLDATDDENIPEALQFSSNFAENQDQEEKEAKSELKYSLETWDNFLGTALDGSRECSGFETEPQSLLFLDESKILSNNTVECKNQALIERFNSKNEEDDLKLQAADVNILILEQQNENKEESEHTEHNKAACSVEEQGLKEENVCKIPENENNTFVVEQNVNKTFVCDDKKNEDLENESDGRNNDSVINDGTVVLSDTDEQLDGTYTKEHEGGSNWEPGEGWFLHPQTNTEVSGQMEVSQSGGEESYVGFSMDDEIMAAIRNELLMKLPQAQGQSSEQVKDTDEWDTEGRSEVLIKYNVYTTPLSPIPEESYSENESYHLIYNREDNSDSENEDWPEPYEEHNSGLPDTETQSMQNAESPIPEPQNRHTPSQDSCCSNDTLFNLEELTFVVNENEKKSCELLETGKNETVLDKDLEKPTLKVEEELIDNDKINEINCVKEVNKLFLEEERRRYEENVLKSKNKFKAEIFTCSIEPTESLSKNEDGMREDEMVGEENNKEFLDIKNDKAFGEEEEEEIDHETFFTEDTIVANVLDHHENKMKITDDSFNETINKNLTTQNDDHEINVANLNHDSNFFDEKTEISLEKNEDDMKKNVETQKENRSNLHDDTFNILNEEKDEIEDIILDEDLNNKNNENNVFFEKHEAIPGRDIIIDETKCTILEETEASVPQNEEDNTCRSIISNEQHKVENQRDEIFSVHGSSSTNNIEMKKSEESIKEGEVVNKIEIAVSHNDNEIKEDLDRVNDMEQIEDNGKSEEHTEYPKDESENVIKEENENVTSQRNGILCQEDSDSVNDHVEETNEEPSTQRSEDCKTSIEDDTIDIKENEEEKFKHQNEEKPELERVSKDDNLISIKQEETNNVEESLVDDRQDTELMVNNNIVKVELNQTLKEEEEGIEYVDSQNERKLENNSNDISKAPPQNTTKEEKEQNLKEEEEGIGYVDGQNERRLENNSNDISKAPPQNSIEEEEEKEKELTQYQNGFLSDTSEVDLENINIDFVKKEVDLSKTDNTIIIIKDEEDLDTNLKKLEINDISKNKLNNIQNGFIPGNSTTLINETKTKTISEVAKNDLNNGHSLSEIKESVPDISLIVENNPNYVTEFLNHERQQSSDSSSTHGDISLQNSKQVSTETISESDEISINIDEPATDSASYVNTNNEFVSDINLLPEYVNVVVQSQDTDEHLYDPVATEDGDVYDALTDIRFTGPSDVQLMSTSFSESADIDEQDWDSGSDTRSSSSGEFIWKEGEHEESVKALRAAPQDATAIEKLSHMEDIEEVSTESSEDDDGDSPEFVPSAWDKYATPTKSALRSPEKTLEKTEVKHKKPKGVWFKKQKYHCVYEYPREPESPIVNSFDLWQPVPTPLIDWEVDTNPYVPIFDGGATSHSECYQQLDSHAKNLYQLPDFSSGMTALDDEFFISSTARPFESFGGLSSQFFPGQSTSDQWMDLPKQPIDNITPDSGVEDITPSNIDGNEFLQAPPKHQVQPLKLLATVVLKNNQISELKSNSKDSLGGLRHARNKLKLDLPPSPSAFTSTKAFTIEPPEEEPVTKREVPSFTTFGKSRFLVQHVDTPTCDEENESKNVSFEALPYKPALVVVNKEDKTKIEVVRGEASLLDSADEDSGIESSTLERKKITNVAD